MEVSAHENQFAALQKQGLTLLRAYIKQITKPGFRENAKQDDRLFAMFIDLTTSDYGISQAALARKIEMSPATVARWARGQSLPSAITRGAVVDSVIELLTKHLSIQEQATIPRRVFAN